jgi:hypothetical protein
MLVMNQPFSSSPVGSELSVALLVQLHPASVPLLHSHQQQFSASGPIDWWKLLDFMCSLSIERASEVLPFALTWLGTSLNDCLCSQRVDPYQTSWWMWVALIFICFAKWDLGGIPLALLSASFSVYVYQGMQSLKLKDTQLQTWSPNGCQCFLLLFLCLVPMQPIRHSINLQLRFESYFQLTNWSSWRYFWALGWTGWPLSAQGRLDPRGKLCCLWCPKKTWTPPLGALDTLTIVENRLEMRKLWPLKVKGTKNSKKQIVEHYKGWFLNTPKKLCMLFCYY